MKESSANDHPSSLAPLPRSSDFDVDPATFLPPTWLNQVLSASPTTTATAAVTSTLSPSPSPSELSTLLDALSDALRESHESLDTSLSESLKAVPWVVRESDRVRQRTNTLRSEVQVVGKRVAGVETGVASSVKTIADADTVVRRVQKAASLLETAASADILLERLESLLASAGVDGSDLVTAADVAAQLRMALLPLKDVSQLHDRFKQLDQADKRLETLAAPQLRKALDNKHAQAAVNSRIVFDHAGRENAFKAQYVALRGAQVVHLWSDAWITQQQRLQQQRAEVTISNSSTTATTNIENETNTTDPTVITKPTTTTTSTSFSSSSSSGPSGEFTAEGADEALRTFYDALINLITDETGWLQDVFPDVKVMLLPALLCESLAALKNPTPRANVFIHPSVSDAVSAADIIADRLFTVGEASIAAAARIATILMPSSSDDKPDDEKNKSNNDINLNGEQKSTLSNEQDDRQLTLVDAVSALLMPHRMFWDSLLQVAVRQARTRAEAIQMINSTENNTTRRPSLADVAKDMELCTRDACAALDTVIGHVTTRSCGVGIAAMKQASSTICSVLSDRLHKVLSTSTVTRGFGTSDDAGNDEDEWTRLGGALRLLMAASGLKRAWDTRKEAALAFAIGTATPVLEVANAVKAGNNNQLSTSSSTSILCGDGNSDHSHSIARVEQFLSQVEVNTLTEAGIVWELIRNEELSNRVVAEFETIDSGNRDFEKIVETVHSVVYNTMFSGVISRFESFSSHDLWTTPHSSNQNINNSTSKTGDMNSGTSGTGGALNPDTDLTMAGLSSSPLRYATEVADYLMAIPEQLEPFVSDEEDAKHATPASVWQFCKVVPITTTPPTEVGDNRSNEGEDGDESEEEMSFAGMWISVLAMGTMELYVEKICSVTRLSEVGAKQLATDADYLCNVMASLGVTPTQEMTLVCKLLECKKDSASFSLAAVGFGSAQHRKLIRRVAAVRGVKVTL